MQCEMIYGSGWFWDEWIFLCDATRVKLQGNEAHFPLVLYILFPGVPIAWYPLLGIHIIQQPQAPVRPPSTQQWCAVCVQESDLQPERAECSAGLGNWDKVLKMANSFQRQLPETVTSGRLHLGTASSPKIWLAKKSSLLAYMELTLVTLSLLMFSTGSSGLGFVHEAFGKWQWEEGILAMNIWPWVATGRAAQTEEACLYIRDITKQEETPGEWHQANSTEGQKCELPTGFLWPFAISTHLHYSAAMGSLARTTGPFSELLSPPAGQTALLGSTLHPQALGAAPLLCLLLAQSGHAAQTFQPFPWIALNTKTNLLTLRPRSMSGRNCWGREVPKRATMGNKNTLWTPYSYLLGLFLDTYQTALRITSPKPVFCTDWFFFFSFPSMQKEMTERICHWSDFSRHTQQDHSAFDGTRALQWEMSSQGLALGISTELWKLQKSLFLLCLRMHQFPSVLLARPAL